VLIKKNRFVQELKLIGTIINNITKDDPIHDENIVKVQLKNQVKYFDVAQISNTEATGCRVLKIHFKDNTTNFIDIESKEMEPLCYPLIFQNGEYGWSLNDRNELPYRRYLSSRLLKPELLEGLDSVTGGPRYLEAEHQSEYEDNYDDQIKRKLRVNRLQVCSRLMQVYAVDMVSRWIDRKLNFISRYIYYFTSA
jgi:hypothetical protein